MPVSIRKYTELKLAFSDYLQRRNWVRLFELCDTSDDETGKTIAAIMTLYDPKKVWSFVDYVHDLSREERRRRRDSVATVCFIIGKIGQTRTEKALADLRQFLLDDHMLRVPVNSALSNLWVLDTRKTSTNIMKKWVLNNEDSDDLQEIGVKSSEYLAKNAPEKVTLFLRKVASLDDDCKVAAKTAKEVIEQSGIQIAKSNEQRIAPKVRRRKSA
jgi:hypothetical protein